MLLLWYCLTYASSGPGGVTHNLFPSALSRNSCVYIHPVCPAWDEHNINLKMLHNLSIHYTNRLYYISAHSEESLITFWQMTTASVAAGPRVSVYTANVPAEVFPPSPVRETDFHLIRPSANGTPSVYSVCPLPLLSSVWLPGGFYSKFAELEGASAGCPVLTSGRIKLNCPEAVASDPWWFAFFLTGLINTGPDLFLRLHPSLVFLLSILLAPSSVSTCPLPLRLTSITLLLLRSCSVNYIAFLFLFFPFSLASFRLKANVLCTASL